MSLCKCCDPYGFTNFPGVSHGKVGNHHYFLSWREPWHKFEDWDWFNGRNFCRDRCMDLVSFDTPGEFQLFAGIMRQGGLALSRIKSLSLASLHFFTNSNIGTTLAGTK